MKMLTTTIIKTTNEGISFGRMCLALQKISVCVYVCAFVFVCVCLFGGGLEEKVILHKNLLP